MPLLRFDGWETTPAFGADVSGDRVTIGRERDNDIVLIHPSVSRYHARLEKRPFGFAVVDLGSRNGVSVNGEPVRERLVRFGDRISFGDVQASYLAAECDTRQPSGSGSTQGDEPTETLPAPDRLPLVSRLFRNAFEVQALIGEGSQASVFRARSRSDDRLVALKVFRGSIRQGTPEEVRFLREGRALARLDHPAIVGILDSGRIEDVPYFALELLPGGSLAQALDRDGRVPVKTAVAMGSRLCDALSHAHAAGILHRDIKPANVMLDAAQCAVLTDFGLAKLLEETGLTTQGVAVGTPLYMSPELFDGKPASVLTDTYALGATLYHVLAGRPPFEGRSISEIAVRVLNPALQPAPLHGVNPEVPFGLSAAVHACLAKEPDRRTATALELGQSLASYR